MNKSLKNWDTINFQDYNTKEKIYLFFVVIYLLCLLFLGKTFSKCQLWDYIYINDIYLLVLVALSYSFKIKISIKTIQYLIFLSVIGLGISYFYNKLPPELTYIYIRQFMLFFYLFSGYRIALVLNYFSRKENILLKLIIWISVIGAILQALNVFYLAISGELRWGVHKHYYSPLVILSVLIFCAFSLTYFTKWWKYLIFSLGLFLAITVNHDSSILAALGILACYLFFKLKVKQQIVLIISSLVVVISLIIWNPNFSDQNATWRLYYWGNITKNTFSDGSFLFGNGFGKPFLSQSELEVLDDIFFKERENKGFMVNDIERYITPPHNSFLTIFFHLGLVGLILLLLPLKVVFNKSKKDIFIISSLFGLFIWSSFNVVLELPHSSIFIWLVFFCTIFIHSSKELSYGKHKTL